MDKLFLDKNIVVEDVTLADVKLQQLYLERDRVFMIAQAATYMFFIYLLVGLVGILKEIFTIQQFFFLLFFGVLILLIASNPYMKSLKEEKEFLDLIESKISKSNKPIRITKKHIRKK